MKLSAMQTPSKPGLNSQAHKTETPSQNRRSPFYFLKQDLIFRQAIASIPLALTAVAANAGKAMAEDGSGLNGPELLRKIQALPTWAGVAVVVLAGVLVSFVIAVAMSVRQVAQKFRFQSKEEKLGNHKAISVEIRDPDALIGMLHEAVNLPKSSNTFITRMLAGIQDENRLVDFWSVFGWIPCTEDIAEKGELVVGVNFDSNSLGTETKPTRESMRFLEMIKLRLSTTHDIRNYKVHTGFDHKTRTAFPLVEATLVPNENKNLKIQMKYEQVQTVPLISFSIAASELNFISRTSMKRAVRELCYLSELAMRTMYTLRGIRAPELKFELLLEHVSPVAVLEQSQTETAEQAFTVSSGTPDGITFESVGSNEKAKDAFLRLAKSFGQAAAFRKWGTSPLKRVLLYGPPGTGKTLLVKALANETDAEIVVINLADIVSKYYGETEQKIQQVFDNAKRIADSGKRVVLFFDEFDALAQRREGSTEPEITARVAAVIQTNLDGFEALSDSIMVIAATNLIESIDPAIRRAGRFNELIEVPLPDDHGRQQIFGIHMGKAERLAERTLFEDVDMRLIASNTEGFNGADIAEVVRRTLEGKALQEIDSPDGKAVGSVTTSELLDAISAYERQ